MAALLRHHTSKNGFEILLNAKIGRNDRHQVDFASKMVVLKIQGVVWPGLRTPFGKYRMNMRKLVIAGFAAFIVMLILGLLWHLVIVVELNIEQSKAGWVHDETVILLLPLSPLVLAFLMSYAYPFGYKGGPVIGEGLRFGILMGLVAHLPTTLGYYGAWRFMTATEMTVDVIYHVVEVAIGGLVIAYVYKGKPQTQS
ncbi:MAG: hypothetical protein O7A08_14085 [SAR324 cluster bacterium]|nr:hypothetical protein [SAR324 cluster bacterium]